MHQNSTPASEEVQKAIDLLRTHSSSRSCQAGRRQFWTKRIGCRRSAQAESAKQTEPRRQRLGGARSARGPTVQRRNSLAPKEAEKVQGDSRHSKCLDSINAVIRCIRCRRAVGSADTCIRPTPRNTARVSERLDQSTSGMECFDRSAQQTLECLQGWEKYVTKLGDTLQKQCAEKEEAVKSMMVEETALQDTTKPGLLSC